MFENSLEVQASLRKEIKILKDKTINLNENYARMIQNKEESQL